MMETWATVDFVDPDEGPGGVGGWGIDPDEGPGGVGCCLWGGSRGGPNPSVELSGCLRASLGALWPHSERFPKIKSSYFDDFDCFLVSKLGVPF